MDEVNEARLVEYERYANSLPERISPSVGEGLRHDYLVLIAAVRAAWRERDENLRCWKIAFDQNVEFRAQVAALQADVERLKIVLSERDIADGRTVPLETAKELLVLRRVREAAEELRTQIYKLETELSVGVILKLKKLESALDACLNGPRKSSEMP